MAILVLQVGYLRLTHPFATRIHRNVFPFDLHVLGTPPALILSQDHTLHNIFITIIFSLTHSSFKRIVVSLTIPSILPSYIVFKD